MGDGVVRRGRGGDDAEEYGPGHQADLGRKDCGRVCSHSKGTPHLNTCRYTLKIFAYRKDICRERRFYLHFANNLYYLFCRLSVLQIFKIFSNGCTVLGEAFSNSNPGDSFARLCTWFPDPQRLRGQVCVHRLEVWGAIQWTFL